MVESSDEPSLIDRIRSVARHAHASSRAGSADDRRPVKPLKDNEGKNTKEKEKEKLASVQDADAHSPPSHAKNGRDCINKSASVSIHNDPANQTVKALPPPAPPPPETDHGDESPSIGNGSVERQKPNIFIRFSQVSKDILLSSWINILLIFVPVGIAVQVAGLNPIVIFALNAIAIVPLAGLLSYATESVASELGDTVGSLMNVTFGNAVELIIL